MLARKPSGRGASAVKYDILTAMGTFALGKSKTQQILVLRLLTLLTARYNWQRDELAVGQREIARMWNVDERTVKRDFAKLRSMGWLVVKRQGARGRVTEYGLDLERILLDTEPTWQAVGPDFAHRMKGEETLPDTNVIPLTPTRQIAEPSLQDGSEWALATAILYREDPASYANWLQALRRDGRAGGRLVLRAPSRFHATYVMSHLAARVIAALQEVDEDITSIVVES